MFVTKIDLVHSLDPSLESLTRRDEQAFDNTPFISEEAISPSGDGQKSLDDFIVQGEFMTPYEYYSSVKATYTTSDPNVPGFRMVETTNGEATTEDINYFWVEDIKNWCRYVYSPDSTTTQGNSIALTLSIWNGKNGWIRIPNFIVNENAAAYNYSDPYGIGNYQMAILGKLENNLISFTRGWSQMLQFDDSSTYKWNKQSFTETPNNFLRLITYLRLQKTTRYTINSPGTFQTVRWQNTNALYTTVSDRLQTNVSDFSPLGEAATTTLSVPITTGIPPVWRLPSGEVALCGVFIFRNDPGLTYYYISDATTDLGSKPNFRKYNNNNKKRCIIIPKNSMGDNSIVVENWINGVCGNFFGDGRNKTIEKDWLREYFIDDSVTENIVSNYDNMLDSSLQHEQVNINKENNLKCSFNINRPVITTDTPEVSDYVKKW